MISFKPIERMRERIESVNGDSDLAYFFDLLLFGELLTKNITLFLVASLNENNERSKFRHEHFLVRANAIGDFSKTIDDVLTGPSAQLLTAGIRDYELKELSQRTSSGMWQYESIKLLINCLDLFNIQHEDLGLKVSLRMWFHYFTLLRNKTKGHGAPTQNPSSIACPMLLSSINLIIDNLTLFKRPWAYLHRNMSGKYRVSVISEKTSDFDHFKKETSLNVENGIYCFIDKPRKVNLLFSNPELTDFYYPNGNLKNDFFETISYVSDDRIEQSAKEYLNPVTQLPQSDTEGLSQLAVLGNCFTNLPATLGDYISRNALESELSTILLDEERFPLITLVGRGGIGKTSLAISVIKKISKETRFDLIIWFSARDIDLLIDGPKQVQTKVLNQNDISKEYCELVYPENKIKDCVDFFSKELSKNNLGKALYIFDNFETLTNPLEIFEWINTWIRNPNKALITSRMSRNFKADYPIEVRGMNDAECNELIELYASKLGIKDLLSPEYIDEIITESDGHPYIIKILLGEVTRTKKSKNIQRIVAEKDKVLSALFKRTFNTLSPASKRVFLTLCSWSSSVPQIAVEAVLWRPENEKMDVQGAIEELQKSSFIELTDEDYNTFISVPLAAAIFGKSEIEVYPEKLKILEDRKLLMEFGATVHGSISNGIAQKIERKFTEVAKRISSIDEFNKELPTLEYIASKYPHAWLFMSKIYEEYEEFERVKYSLRELLKTPLPNNEKSNYWFKLANICRLTEDWEGESHALAELALIPKVSFDLISDCANRINNFFYYHPEEKKIESKQLLLKKVIDVMSQRISGASATDYSRLAWLLLNNDNIEKAKEFVEKGLSIDNENTHCIKLFDKIQAYN